MKHCLILLLVCCSVFASFPKDWEQLEQAQGGEQITFHVALKQRNLDKLEALLYSVSDPDSPRYGKHVSKEHIAELVHPPKEEHDRVANFFTREGVTVKSFGDALKITAPVSVVSDIFSASFQWYHHAPSGHKAIRASQDGIVIPDAIKEDIYMVTGLVSYPIIMRRPKKLILDENVVRDTKYGFFAPYNIRNLYNIPAGTKATNPKSSQCALEFYPEGAFAIADLQRYCTLSDEVFYNYTKIVGPFTDGAWGNTESELDVQLLATIGLGAENWFWTIVNGWIYEMAVEIANYNAPPSVFSISYGWPEVLTCNSAVVNANCTSIDNAAYIDRANTEIQKLGAQGISVITCSQDEGAPSSANEACTNKTHPIFGIYPGSSPFLTTVSGTTVLPDSGTIPGSQIPPICSKTYPCSNSTHEVPCDVTNTEFEWTTGGGFSEFAVRPSYQDDAVQGYLNSDILKPPTQFYWPKNRGYPDVSAVGARTLIVSDNYVTVAEGTSASTPIVAGIVTLLNDYRLNNNKSPLGFLNILLYKMAADHPAAFKDIVTGNNTCSIGRCCEYGYGSGVGWDPVSGLGAFNYQEALAYVKTLP